MAKNLVIVESPSKSKTIEKYLAHFPSPQPFGKSLLKRLG